MRSMMASVVFSVMLVLSGATWAEVGMKNIESLRKLNLVSIEMKGQAVSPALMSKLNADSQAFYAAKISCHVAEKSSMAIHLENVAPVECFQAIGQLWGNIKIVDFDQRNLAIDALSGGKTILVYQPSDFVGVGMAGELVPGSKMDAAVVNFMYKFGDDGLINGMVMDFDSSILDDVQQKVTAFRGAQMHSGTTLLAEGLSWTEVGRRNIDTLLKLNELMVELKGKQLTPALMAKISSRSLSHYASKLSCRTGRHSAFSVQLSNVPAGECFQALGQMWGDFKIVDFVQKDFAIDPTSGGKTILAVGTCDLVGATRDGDEVPGTNLKALPVTYRYKFNNAGLVDFFEEEFDSGILLELKSKVRAFANSANQAQLVSLSAAVDMGWKEVGERNLASLQALDEISKQLKGKLITPAIMAQMIADQAAFYAPKMDCLQAKLSGMGVNLAGVSGAECFQAMGKTWRNVQVVDLFDEHLSIDPQSGGRTILSRTPVEFFGSTPSGQMVPNTKVKGLVLCNRYHFNDQGLVDFFEQEFDTGVLWQVQSKSMNFQAQQGLELVEDVSSHGTLYATVAGAMVAMVSMGLSGAIYVGFKVKRKLCSGHSLPLLSEAA